MKKEFEKLKGAKSGAFHDIPEGYFDDLPKNIMQSIEDVSNKKRQHNPVYAIAAVFILMLSVVGLWFYQLNPSRNNANPIALNVHKQPNSLDDTVKLSKLSLPNDTITTNKSNGKRIESDSLLFNAITVEDIQQYLIEMEEFEF
ncbi:MAG: hypothetical protein HOO86_08315 [Bacteroidales bacterium]|nr:hypothetical protein [Bacteroidales bacterium]